MSKLIVKYSFDAANPPPLTDQQKKEVATLAALPDETIDFSDSPRLTESFWTSARRSTLDLRATTPTTIRIDDDVSNWLKADGADLEERINQILRREMSRANEA